MTVSELIMNKFSVDLARMELSCLIPKNIFNSWYIIYHRIFYQNEKQTPPLPQKMTTPQIFLGTFQNISNQKKNFFFSENFLEFEKFLLKNFFFFNSRT